MGLHAMQARCLLRKSGWLTGASYDDPTSPIIWEPESAGRWVHRPTGVVIERYREQWIQKSFARDRVVGRTYWRVVLPSSEAKGRYRSKGDAIPFAETCVTRLDERYAKTAAAADNFTETWLTLSQLLRTTDKDQHEAILSALDNPTVIGLRRRSRTDIRLIMEGDSELWSRRARRSPPEGGSHTR